MRGVTRPLGFLAGICLRRMEAMRAKAGYVHINVHDQDPNPAR